MGNTNLQKVQLAELYYKLDISQILKELECNLSKSILTKIPKEKFEQKKMTLIELIDTFKDFQIEGILDLIIKNSL